MKIAINACYGGFSLSNKAVARLAELQGKPAYFFKGSLTQDGYTPVSIDDPGLFVSAFSVPNPNDYDPQKLWDKFYLNNRPADRTDPLLIQVIEELGEEANGGCAKLRVIEIPDGVEWEIDEYDGIESVHEKHRSWG